MSDRPALPSGSSDAAADLRLERDVVAGGFCIGCGVCTVPPGSPFAVRQDAIGRFQAQRIAATATTGEPALTAVCPFGHDAADESRIGDDLYGPAVGDVRHDPKLGYYRACYAGHVAEADYRTAGSSGGLGSWMLAELLRADLVDRVIHVAPGANGHAAADLFRFRIVERVEDVRAGAHSRYYPVEMSAVLAAMRATPGRYAAVGVPCFVKAMRLLARADPIVAERLDFALAIFCGHLKTRHFASYLGWQLGVPPAALDRIDFRVKEPARPANAYAVRATGRVAGETISRQRPTAELDGTNWAHGYFKYEACDYCDDVAGETADLAVGDAWLPGYVDDWRGTNVAVVRHPTLHALIETARAEGRLALAPLAAEDVVRSQDASYRHRRAGLAVRLRWRRWRGHWTPPKRVRPADHRVPWLWQALFALRIVLQRRSHTAFQDALARDDVGHVARVQRRPRRLYRSLQRFARKVARPV
jgi:coenzyme F420-reducing hydrogenase beta subunit